jgi:hypothetical protein
MGKYCTNCGSVLPKGFDDLAYCILCGKKQHQHQHQNQHIYCSRCGTNNPLDMLFCLNCGQRIGVQSVQSIQVLQPTQAVLKPNRRKVKKSVMLYILVAVLTALAVALTAIVQPWKYIGGNGEDEIKLIEVSGTKEVKQTFDFGLEIHAAENALDIDRTFTAVQIEDDNRLIELTEQLEDQTGIVLEAFEIDAGLAPDQRFPDTFTMTYDLRKLDIPESLYGHLSVVRLGDDGTQYPLVTKHDGAKLICSSDQNSLFLIVVTGLLTFGPMTILAGQYMEKYGIKGESQYSSITLCNGRYRLMWPETMGAVNEDAVEKLIDDMQVEYQLHFNSKGFKSRKELIEKIAALDPNMKWRNNAKKAFGNLYSNKEFNALLEKFMDPEWQDQNLLPYTVLMYKRAIIVADEYFRKERSFNMKERTLDLIIDPKLEELALMKAPNLRQPYILLAGWNIAFPDNEKIYNNAKKRDLEQARIVADVYITIVHELFHVVQADNVRIRYDVYLSYFEATAVTVEKEAFDYFKKKKTDVFYDKLKYEESYVRHYETLTLPLGSGASYSYSDEYTQQGYLLSEFVMFMRDKYFASDPNKFMEKVVSSLRACSGYFDATWNDDLLFITSLCKVTGKSKDVIAKDYEEWLMKNDTNILNRTNAVETLARSYDEDGNKYTDFMPHLIKNHVQKLPTSNKSLLVRFDSSYKPLSAAAKILDIDLGDESDEAYLVIALNNEELLKNKKMKRYYYPDINTKKSIELKEKYTVIKEFKKQLSGILEVNCYHDDKEYLSVNDVFVLTKPDAPKLSLRDGMLHVIFDDSSSPYKKVIVDGYALTVIDSKGNSVLLKTDKTSADIPLTDSGAIDVKNGAISGSVLKSEGADAGKYKDVYDVEAYNRALDTLKGGSSMAYSAYYNEYIKDEDITIDGPTSKEAKLEGTAQTSKKTDLVGTWKGLILNTQPITMTVKDGGSSGHQYKIEFSLYGDEMLFAGDDNGDGTVTLYMAMPEAPDTWMDYSSLIINSENEILITFCSGVVKRQK